MSLKEQLNADLKDAMKSGDAVRKSVIRNIRAAVKETEQRQREDLVKKALKKHNVSRPNARDEEAVAAYNQAVEDAIAAENVEEKSLLDDPEILNVVQKLIKMRQDSIADATRAGRNDLIEAEQAELVILEGYLPEQMSREEIAAEARAAIAQTGAEGMRDMGKVMGLLSGKLKGKADGKMISEVVRELLSE